MGRIATLQQTASALIEVEYNTFTLAALPGCLDRPYGNGVVATPSRPRPGEEGTVAVLVAGLCDGEVWVTVETRGGPPASPVLDDGQDVAGTAVSGAAASRPAAWVRVRIGSPPTRTGERDVGIRDPLESAGVRSPR